MQFASQTDFLKVPAKNFRPEASATAPTSPVAGQLWTDTSVTPAKLRWYDGTQWVVADSSGGAPTGSITDAQVASNAAIQLSKLAVNPVDRANHTGTQLAATVSDFIATVRTVRLDQMAIPTSFINVNSQRLTAVATPVTGTDAANKAYVDNARAGVAVKDPVRVVVTDSAFGPNAAAGTVDGVTLANNDRVLVTGQTDANYNGIWRFQGAGAAMARTSDADEAGDIKDGTLVAVSEGPYEGQQWIQTGTIAATAVPGTMPQTWTRFSTGGQTYTAGTGLTLTGAQFALSTPVSIANGGTGGATAAAARTALGAVSKYVQAISSSIPAGGSFNVTHNLNTSDVDAVVRMTGTGDRIFMDYRVTSANALTLFTDVAFGVNALTVAVFG